MKTIRAGFLRFPAFGLAIFIWLSAFSLSAAAGAPARQRLCIGLTAGYFYPRQAAFRKIYDKPLWPIGLQLDLGLNRKMIVFAAARYLQTSGNSVLLAGQRPEETYALRWRMATLRLGMNYQLRPARCAPFLGAGISYTFYKEQWLDASLTSEGRKAGFFVQAGGRYRLSRRLQALAQLDYSSIPAGDGAQGRVNLGGLNLSLGLLAGIF